MRKFFTKILLAVVLSVVVGNEVWAVQEPWTLVSWNKEWWNNTTSVSYNNFGGNSWGGTWTYYNDANGMHVYNDCSTSANVGYKNMIYGIVAHAPLIAPSYCKITRQATVSIKAQSSYYYSVFQVFFFDTESDAKTTVVETRSQDSRAKIFYTRYGQEWGESGTTTVTYTCDNSTGSAEKTTDKYLLFMGNFTNGNGESKNCTQEGGFLGKGYTDTYTYCKVITFNSNEGDGSMSQQVIAGSGNLTTSTFNRPNMAFSGWNTKADGTGTAYADGAAITASATDKGPLTLYAQWVDPVCINTTTTYGYLTVQAAVNAITEGGQTIQMHANSTENVTIASDDNLTLDLNGYVLQGASGRPITVNSGANFTLKDSGAATATHYFSGGNQWALIASPTEEQQAAAVAFESLTARPGSNVIISVKGGVITGGNSGGITTSGTFTMTAGNVIGNSGNSGTSGIHVAAGTATISNVKVVGNCIYNRGSGGICAYAPAEATNCDLSFNYLGGDEGHGAAVRVFSDVTLTNCRMNYNWAVCGGGAMSDAKYSSSVKHNVVMTGCEVKGNTAQGKSWSRAGGIDFNTAYFSLTLIDCSIINNYTNINTYSGVKNGNTAADGIIIGGNTVISGNIGGSSEKNMYLLSGQTATISGTSPLTDGANIRVTTATAPAVGSPVDVTSNSTDLAYFHSDNANYTVINENNSASPAVPVIKLAIPVCVINESTTPVYYSSINKALEQIGTEATTIKLLQNTTENLTIANGKTITLDLNGKVLTSASSGLASVIYNYGNLTVKDSDAEAVHNFKVVENDLWQSTSDAATNQYESLTARPSVGDVIAVKGGCITGGKGKIVNLGGYANGNNPLGGAVLNYASGTFTLEGGNIVGNGINYVDGDKTSVGAGIYSRGILNVKGGRIIGNTAICNTGVGGAICAEASGSITITGGEIKFNLAKNGDGAITGGVTTSISNAVIAYNKTTAGIGSITAYTDLTVGGNVQIIGNEGADAVISNLRLADGKTITISSTTPLIEGASIGVTTATAPTATPVQVTARSTADYSAYFTSDNADYNVENISNRIFLTNPNIIVEDDPTSTYNKTQIVNGSFDTEPWMDFTYKKTGVRYTSCSHNSSVDGDCTDMTFHGVGGGWNTTEYHCYYGNLFEFADGVNHIVDHNTNIPNSDKYVEMNCYNAATLYQDLATSGFDVIRWTLKHAIVTGGDVTQSLRVEIGAPERDGSGNIVNASGTGSSINTKIISSSKAIFRNTGVKDASGQTSTIGFGGSDIANLSLNKYSQNTQWYQASGVYVVPEGQTVSRFAFVSEAATPNVGNLLDGITFSTLVGNLHANLDDYDNIIISGYWGDTDATKKLCVKVGETVHQIDMSGQVNATFKITFPKDKIGDATTVDIYHQDYEQTKRTVKIDPYKQVTNFDPKFGTCTFTLGLNAGADAAIFTDSGQTVNNNTHAITQNVPFTVKIGKGFKYYDGTVYDMYVKITPRTTSSATTWKYYLDSNYLQLYHGSTNTYKDFDVEIWLQHVGTNTKVDNVTIVGGSCAMGTQEGTRPYSDDGNIYTNIPDPTNVWQWNDTYKAWVSNSSAYDQVDYYIIGHGVSADNSLKGGYYTTYGLAEFVVGYITKDVTFRTEFTDGSAATDVTFSYPNPATFSNNVLKVPVNKAIGTLPAAAPSTVDHWYVGNDKTTTYTSAQLSELVVTDDMTVTAVLPAACVNTFTNKQYAAVQNAVNEAENDQTIQMLFNSTENVTISGKNLTLDLNGKTITSTGTSNNAITVESGTLTINDNTENIGGVTGNIALTGGTTTINNGKFNGTITKGDGATFYLYGGKYSFDPTPFLDIDHAAKSIDEMPYIYEVVSDPDSIVCTDGTHSFTSLQHAIEFNTTANITLSQDIEENLTIAAGKDITLDLKGHTITSATGNTVIANNGTLTVIDSSDEKTGTITGATTGAGIDNANGTLNLYAGNVTGNANGVDNNGTLTIGGTTKITGNGTVEARNNLYMHDGRTLTFGTGTYAPTDDMLIGITTETAPTAGNDIALTGANDADYSNRFFGDDSDYSVFYNVSDKKLYFTNDVRIIITAEPFDAGSLTLTYADGSPITDPDHVLRGHKVTIKATPVDDYAFKGWFNQDGTMFNGRYEYTFTADKSYSIEARFTSEVIWVRMKK